jgi:hypothetical protein
MDSVQSGLVFASGEVAIMVNWFGFAAMSETLADSKVKGCIDIAQIPLNSLVLPPLSISIGFFPLLLEALMPILPTNLSGIAWLQGWTNCSRSKERLGAASLPG